MYDPVFDYISKNSRTRFYKKRIAIVVAITILIATTIGGLYFFGTTPLSKNYKSPVEQLATNLLSSIPENSILCVTGFIDLETKKKAPESDYLAEELTTEIAKQILNNFLVENSLAQEAIKRLKIEQTGPFFDKKTISRIGNFLGTDYIITGSIYVKDGDRIVNARCVSVKDLQIVSAAKVRYTHNQDVENSISKLLKRGKIEERVSYSIQVLFYSLICSLAFTVIVFLVLRYDFEALYVLIIPTIVLGFSSLVFSGAGFTPFTPSTIPLAIIYISIFLWAAFLANIEMCHYGKQDIVFAIFAPPVAAYVFYLAVFRWLCPKIANSIIS